MLLNRTHDKFLLLLSMVSFCGFAQANPLAISTCTALANIKNNMAADYVLVNDLDCQNIQFYPITGANGQALSFSGSLDGAGFTIANLNIQPDKRSRDIPVGLFSSLDGATITNINFNTAKVYSRPDYDIGLIAGVANAATLSNITANTLWVAKIDKTHKDSTNSAGGLLGYSFDTTLTNVAVNDITLERNKFAGGLIGRAGNTTLVGGSVTDLWWTGDIAAGEAYSDSGFGGLIGRINGDVTIKQSFVSGGHIHSDDTVGGLVGLLNPSATVTIENSYSNIRVQGKDYIGGLIGSDDRKGNEIILKNVFVVGDVVSSVEESMGTVIGRDNTRLSERAKTGPSYFDKYTTSHKPDLTSGDKISVGLTTDQMQDPENASYFGAKDAQGNYVWDRTIWIMEAGEYPRLQPYVPPVDVTEIL